MPGDRGERWPHRGQFPHLFLLLQPHPRCPLQQLLLFLLLLLLLQVTPTLPLVLQFCLSQLLALGLFQGLLWAQGALPNPGHLPEGSWSHTSGAAIPAQRGDTLSS